MLFLYRLGIAVFSLLMRIAAFWHPKAKLWVQGRQHLLDRIARETQGWDSSAWFHFASLGEFEQGRPVMEALKKARPELKIVVTFFSPSGYEIRKNYAGADKVFYLPMDTPRNAATFIRLIKPEMAVFTKYEYWFFYFRELYRQEIPLYMISSIFRPDQVFFKWYGSLHRQMLAYVKHFFVQNEESKNLLSHLGFQNTSLAGDTRFDRVAALSQHPKKIQEVAEFCEDSKVLVAGSTWPEDKALLATLLLQHPNWKLILAPHEVDEAHIQEILNRFPEGQAIRYSELKRENLKGKNEFSILTTQYSLLVIDTIGLLSTLYAYGDIAYIGGGFGKGIHNTLEAATYGIPIIFGPNYQKFQEAKDLISEGAGFSIANAGELTDTFQQLTDADYRKKAGTAAKYYVQSRVGATEIILKQLLK
ncbi:MAG: hypothetical protein RLZ47_203 [Bacteroidota bacterium]|jgi:3-deoxy-D-manno-octulosonic-acid transferase